MLSLSSLGALFFRGGLVDRVITGYSGDTFPNFTPNPLVPARVPVRRGRGRALVVPRVRAAARSRGEGAARRSRPARSPARRWRRTTAYATVDSPFGPVGLLAPLAPDVAILHAPVADEHGNVALAPPLLEGVWGALAARRGAIVTVEQDRRRRSPSTPDLVRIPAHRVLAVCEAPLGAHPGGLFTGGLPVDGYGEDYEFWVEARAATRGDDYDDWIRALGPRARRRTRSTSTGSAPSGSRALRAKAEPDSWQLDAEPYPPDLDAPVNAWEIAATFGARHLADRVDALGARRGARRRRGREPRGVARRRPGAGAG